MFSPIVLITAVIALSFNEGQCSYLSDYSDDYSNEDWDLMPGRGLSRRPDAGKINAKYTNWGVWGGKWDKCEPGHYARAAQLKVERHVGASDDSSVNGIRLHCVEKWPDQGQHHVTSLVGGYGTWRDSKSCHESRIIGISLKVDGYQGHCKTCDDVATTGLRIHCGLWINGILERRESHELYGNKWGEWQESKWCPKESYVCGIHTQIDNDGNQADAQHGRQDITGLNSVEMLCCPWDHKETRARGFAPL